MTSRAWRPRPIVLGIALVAAGVVLILASGRQTERIITVGPGVQVASPVSPGRAWELLIDASGGGEQNPAGGIVEAEEVAQYGVLSDGRVVVEGQVDGIASWLLIEPAGSAAADVQAVFGSRSSLSDFLSKQSLSVPAMSAPAATPSRDLKYLWGGAACITAGLVVALLGLIPRQRRPPTPAARPPSRGR